MQDKFNELQLLQLFLEVSCDLTKSMPLCPISEIPALHSLGLWPKLEALQILRRSQKIREAPTESPFVVSTLHSLHYMHHLNWSSVARTSAVNWDLRVLWMLYGFMKLCLRYTFQMFRHRFCMLFDTWTMDLLSTLYAAKTVTFPWGHGHATSCGTWPLGETWKTLGLIYALFSGNPLFEACGSSKGQMIQKTVLRWT